MAKTQNEQVLDNLVKEVTEKHEFSLSPPVFELYSALLAMTLAILMFLFPASEMSNAGLLLGVTAFLPQHVWAIFFCIAGITSTIGMLFNKSSLRITALVILTLCYGSLTYVSIESAPSFGAAIVSWLTVFSVASIALVRFTGIHIWDKRR